MIVAPLPEVEGPDGPQEQQHRPRNEDHGSDFEQPRGAGGLHGHGGVRLRAAGRGRVKSARSDRGIVARVGMGNIEGKLGVALESLQGLRDLT